MQFSRFGEKLTGHSGILELMDDLGKAMQGEEKKYMLGGGNPAHIPEVQATLRRELDKLMGEEGQMESLLGNYNTPQGNMQFIRTLVGFFRREYGWDLTEKNIAVTNGSQSAFFYLFNLLAGEMPDSSFKKILLPLTPEYIGYADQGIYEGMFKSYRPEIEFLGAHRYKYHVNFKHLEVSDDIAAICVSRPTNPTGNVLTDEEIAHLAQIARDNGIPFIVDNAYGVPFPGIIFNDVKPHFDDNMILSMSLSKIGLPNARNGIIIAREEIITALTGMNAIVSLATGGIGQQLIEPLIASGEVKRLAQKVVRPFYQERMEQAMAWIQESFDDHLPYYVHKCEGALFLWMWFRDLPISSKTLYERLKKRSVVIVPGEYFFPGLEEDWQHRHECIRLNYALDPADVQDGIRIIGEEVSKTYQELGVSLLAG